MSEYAGGAVKKNKNKTQPLSRHLHKTNALAKDVYDSNNRRNNDLYGVTKANGLLRDIHDQSDDINIYNHGLAEEAMIALIDNKNKLLTEDEEN